jgi:hypothetical protein
MMHFPPGCRAVMQRFGDGWYAALVMYDEKQQRAV